MNSKIERIKEHVKEKKAVYISGIAGVVIGAIGGMVMCNRRSISPIGYIDTHFANILGGWKAKNYLYQRISMYGNVIGRPGKAVYDTTTNKLYASESLVAAALGVSNSNVSSHLNGRRNHVKGHILKWVD